ncbi:MAG: amidohydrolase family protein [Acidobacteriota bacterium]|nr:amidohydrolase family protein [Acidobacteriota bacterium]
MRNRRVIGRLSAGVILPRLATIAALCCFLLCASAFAQKARPARPKPAAAKPEQAGSIVLRGGKLLTITHGTIENGVLVMENGKITAVGAAGAVSLPRNARVIDVTGMTVYPGLIDSETQLGLTEISAVEMTNDTQETSDAIMPHMHVYDAFHAESELIPVTRMNGITNAIVAPQTRDTLPGQDSFVQLDGRSSDEMLLVRDIAMPLNFTGEQRRNESFQSAKFPQTRMGMAAQLRQVFIDAQDYAQKFPDYDRKSAAWEKEKKGDKPSPPKRDLKLEALLPYLEGKRPVVLAAAEPSDLQVALGLVREFHLKVILNHVSHSQILLDQIAATQLPVIVGPIYETPKDNERYDSVYKLPAELVARGVKIAFASYDAHNVRNLPYQAGYAVAFGLSHEEAMKALTMNPAEIWGVAGQLGSLDAGKTANVVVADGDPLELTTDVKHVFIAGREVPMESRQTRLRDEYMKH